MAKTTLEKIVNYVNERPNNAAGLAFQLGYATPNTIHQWIKNGVVPPRAAVAVENYFDLMSKSKEGKK